MSLESAAPLDAGMRAALEAGKHVTYVCPPAAWAAAPLLSAIPDVTTDGPRIVAIAPEIGDVLDVAGTLRPLPGFEPILPVTGIARSARLLSAGAVKTLAVTPRDLTRLLETSKIKLGKVRTLVLLWPEFMLAAGETELIDTILAEAGDAQRIIVTSDPVATKDFVERHARRSPFATFSQPPEVPGATARYVVIEGERRIAAARGILDTLNPTSSLLWEPAPDRYERWHQFAEDPSVTVTHAAPTDRRVDVAIAVELPSAEILAQLNAVASDVIVLARGSQVPYLKKITRTLRSLRLPGVADRAGERAHQLRQSVRERLEGDLSADLLAIAPLFDEFEPALVAAALAKGAGAPEPVVSAAPPPVAWVRIQLNVGKKDRTRPADIVGALLNGVGLPKDAVGKIELRDTSSIVEIKAEAAARAQRALSGLTIRGKSVTARVSN